MTENCFDYRFGESELQERNQQTKNLETQNEWIPMQEKGENNVLLSSLIDCNSPDENLLLINGEEIALEENLMPGKTHTIQKPERRRKGKDKRDISSPIPNAKHLIDSYSAKSPDGSRIVSNAIFSVLKVKQNEGVIEETDFLTNVFLGSLLGFGQLVLVGLLLDILWNLVWTVLHVTFLILMAVIPTLVPIGILGAIATVTFSAMTKLAMEH